MVRTPESLRALLANLIDYAGLYPPAALPLAVAAGKYEEYAASPVSWILNRLILPAASLREIQLKPGWRVSLLVEEEPGPLPRAVETLETRLARKLSLPTYCETTLDRIAGAFAKIRTGGVVPEAIPTPEHVAAFLTQAAAMRTPFKATAGLHHAIRSERPLTYAPDSPRAVMHGFLNVFAAAAFALQGAEKRVIRELLEETDPRAFQFGDDGLRWRGRRISTAQIHTSRFAFAHSFGSCSFEEPVTELRELGLLP